MVLEMHTDLGNFGLLFKGYIYLLLIRMVQNMAFVFFRFFLLKLRKNLCPVLTVTEDAAFFVLKDI